MSESEEKSKSIEETEAVKVRVGFPLPLSARKVLIPRTTKRSAPGRAHLALALPSGRLTLDFLDVTATKSKRCKPPALNKKILLSAEGLNLVKKKG